MSDAIPIIDLAPLGHGGDGTRIVARAIGEACRGVGFFYLRNAAIPKALREAVFTAARDFFASEPSAKDVVSIRRSPHNRGYVGMAVEALDPSRGPDRKEAFNVGLELDPADPELLAGTPFRGPNLWPVERPAFRSTLLRYYEAAWQVGRDLHRAIAVDLGLPEHFFADKLDRPMATLRLLHYPPGQPSTDQMGAGEHTDYGNLTLLATDEVGGLEVRSREGRWLQAPVIPDAFVCNIGDCLMRWTNDTYVSTPHRVVNTSGRERYSVAFFLDCNPEAEVTCLPTCTDATRPPKYPPILAGDYLRARLDATYGTHESATTRARPA